MLVPSGRKMYRRRRPYLSVLPWVGSDSRMTVWFSRRDLV